jgi:hypothetical protein
MSAKRNTRTGGVLEAMVLPALGQGGYSYKTQVNIGKRLGLGCHIVDVVAEKGGHEILVSMKWQQVSGTAEEKVPYEVICLLHALESGNYAKAYVVLGGEGWKLRDYFVGEGLKKYLGYADKVEILTLEGFVGRANTGKV